MGCWQFSWASQSVVARTVHQVFGGVASTCKHVCRTAPNHNLLFCTLIMFWSLDRPVWRLIVNTEKNPYEFLCSTNFHAVLFKTGGGISCHLFDFFANNQLHKIDTLIWFIVIYSHLKNWRKKLLNILIKNCILENWWVPHTTEKIPNLKLESDNYVRYVNIVNAMLFTKNTIKPINLFSIKRNNPLNIRTKKQRFTDSNQD